MKVNMHGSDKNTEKKYKKTSKSIKKFLNNLNDILVLIEKAKKEAKNE